MQYNKTVRPIGIYRDRYSEKKRICGDDTNSVTHVKERFFRHFTLFGKVKLLKSRTNIERT